MACFDAGVGQIDHGNSRALLRVEAQTGPSRFARELSDDLLKILRQELGSTKDNPMPPNVKAEIVLWGSEQAAREEHAVRAKHETGWVLFLSYGVAGYNWKPNVIYVYTFLRWFVVFDSLAYSHFVAFCWCLACFQSITVIMVEGLFLVNKAGPRDRPKMLREMANWLSWGFSSETESGQKTIARKTWKRGSKLRKHLGFKSFLVLCTLILQGSAGFALRSR